MGLGLHQTASRLRDLQPCLLQLTLARVLHLLHLGYSAVAAGYRLRGLLRQLPLLLLKQQVLHTAVQPSSISSRKWWMQSPAYGRPQLQLAHLARRLVVERLRVGSLHLRLHLLQLSEALQALLGEAVPACLSLVPASLC